GRFLSLFFFSSRRRHTRLVSDWSSDVCSSDLQPRNRLARLVESSFPQERVVAALVEVHDDPFRLDFDHTSCFHEFAIELFGGSGVKASQVLGEPAIAPIGQYRHGGVKIPIEAHLTC